MNDPRVDAFIDEALKLRYSRRSALKRAAALGLSVPAVATALGPAKTTRAQDPVTITWFASRDTTGYSQQQVDAFNAQNPSIQISYQEQGATTTDLHDKFVTIATAQDSSADIVSMDVPFVPEFAAAGWTIPVEDILPEPEREAFFPGTIEGATYDDQLYAVPWYNNGPGLFYRKDLLDEAGMEPPKSYDELVEASKQLQTADMSGFIFQAAQTEGGLISWLEVLWGYGGEILNDDGEVALKDGTAAVDSMQRLIDFIYTDKISPEATLTMATGPDAQNVFVEGRAVFLRMWMTATSAMEADISAVKGKWDVTTLPSANGEAPGPGCLGTWNLGVSKFSRYPEESATAIQFLTSLEQQTQRYLGSGSLPARSAVFDDPAVQEKYAYVDRLREALASLKPRPVTPYYSQMSPRRCSPTSALR
jgi:multiple sugar transport system substrate-binding protein